MIRLCQLPGFLIEQIQPPVQSVQPAAGEHTSSWLFSISPSLFFWLHSAACGILVPRPGIKPGGPGQ